MKVAALMPVKGFRNAKQRLTPLLDGAARELLAETMFRDVLREVRLACGLTGTYVVTGSYNFSVRAHEVNNENLLVLKSPSLAERYRKEVLRLWEAGSPL